MRKTFLDDLPVNYKGIDWTHCLGYEINFIYDDIIGIIKIIKYNKDKQTLIVKYKDKIKLIKCNSLKNAYLANVIGKQSKWFKLEISTKIKDNKRNLTILDQEYRRDSKERKWKWYRYKCNVCGWDNGWIEENRLLSGKGCSCCDGKTVVEGINDIPTTAPWMIPYFKCGYDEAKLYTRRSQQRIYPICPDCGRVKQNSIQIYSIYENHSIGCICRDGISYPNKLIYYVIEQCKNQFYSYVREYSPEWAMGKFYDLYLKTLDNKEYIIEMDGAIGHGNKILPNSEITLQESIEIDNLKNSLANEHKIDIIRVDCIQSDLEYIKNNILNSRINNILDLSSVNWKQCDEMATKSLVKIVCNIYSKNTLLSTADISDMVGIHQSTVRVYLIKGTKFGWCKYNPEEVTNKNHIKIWDNNRKKVICTTTNKKFNSIIEASKYYGLKSSSGIGECCNKKIKSAGKLPDGTKLQWEYIR
ncbi:MAG: hypothetical protein K0S18_79 [Anaerocolumna sp.]|nr:hypothetical protein [Anaerocolumna sp.]